MLVAGDLYERSLFTLKDYKELFHKIADFGKDIFYVAGNHDYIGEGNETIFKMKPDNLHIFPSKILSITKLIHQGSTAYLIMIGFMKVNFLMT